MKISDLLIYTLLTQQFLQSILLVRFGFPEAKIPLAYAVTTLALSTKSNLAYAAIKQALDVVKTTPTSIPNHLKDAHFKGAEKLGHVGYKISS